MFFIIGKCHDSKVLNETLAPKFNGGYRPFDGAIVLADSAYGASDWLIPMRECGPEATDAMRAFYA